MSRHMTERTTVRLPEELVARAKRKAANEGVSMTALIEEGLRRVLSDGKGHAPATRALPPVSAATGGLMPGVDLNDTAMLEEMDDLARFGSRP
jgi:Arc/MetJ-type ribon-helix-helix transcriptional regulator